MARHGQKWFKLEFQASKLRVPGKTRRDKIPTTGAPQYSLSLYQRESQVRPNSICILKRDKIEMLLFAILESFESNHSIASLDWIAPSDDGTGVQMQIQSDSKSVQMATGFDLTFWHHKSFQHYKLFQHHESLQHHKFQHHKSLQHYKFQYYKSLPWNMPSGSTRWSRIETLDQSIDCADVEPWKIHLKFERNNLVVQATASNCSSYLERFAFSWPWGSSKNFDFKMQGIPPNRSLRRNAKQENVKNKLHEWRVSKWNFYWLERPCSRLCTTLFSPLFTTLCTTLYIKLPYSHIRTRIFSGEFSVVNSVSQRIAAIPDVCHSETLPYILPTCLLRLLPFFCNLEKSHFLLPIRTAEFSAFQSSACSIAPIAPPAHCIRFSVCGMALLADLQLA